MWAALIIVALGQGGTADRDVEGVGLLLRDTRANDSKFRYLASWKMMPRVCRCPERRRLTP